MYPKAIFRDGERSTEWREILDFIDLSEDRFLFLHVKLDMEKIMEKLGGVFK